MMNFYSGSWGGAAGWMYAFGPLFPILMLWSIFWKGLALWHAGRRGSAWWFAALLVVNTAGILEIVYLFGVIKLKFSQLFSR